MSIKTTIAAVSALLALSVLGAGCVAETEDPDATPEECLTLCEDKQGTCRVDDCSETDTTCLAACDEAFEICSDSCS